MGEQQRQCDVQRAPGRLHAGRFSGQFASDDRAVLGRCGHPQPGLLAGLIGTLGDADGFDIFGWDGSGYTISLGTAADGRLFNFEAGGISRFGLCGIDVGPGLDPDDTTVFVDAPGVIPEPATWAMMIAGFGLVGGMARRRRMAPFA